MGEDIVNKIYSLCNLIEDDGGSIDTNKLSDEDISFLDSLGLVHRTISLTKDGVRTAYEGVADETIERAKELL